MTTLFEAFRAACSLRHNATARYVLIYDEHASASYGGFIMLIQIGLTQLRMTDQRLESVELLEPAAPFSAATLPPGSIPRRFVFQD